MAAQGQKKSLDNPDETRDFEQGKLQTATLADFKVARAILQPGWKWSEHVKPLAQTESCQVRHTGYVVSGHMKVVMDDDRSEVDLGPGDAYVLEPGHDAWVVGDEPFVGVDVSTEMVEQFAKEEEDKGLIDRAKDKLSGQ
jgi:mannose-6-phosphate isomerase-like protein (cupin superfamily)